MPSAEHSVLFELSDSEIERRLAAVKAGLDPDAEPAEPELGEGGPNTQSLVVPWAAAADEYIDWSKNPERRVYTGIEEFDAAMRGLAPGELMLVVGYAHSGKTVFTTQMLLHNHDKRVAIFTPDETRVLVLVKMASILHGISAEELENRLREGESETEALLRSVASDYFPRFAVWDDISDLGLMSKALEEARSMLWFEQGGPELVVIDYADLVTGAGEDVPSKMAAIKAWGKRENVPLVLLHQSSRSKGANGQKMGLDSGGYGGEQQATFMVGVRRKRTQYDGIIDELEARIAAATTDATEQRLQAALMDAQYERNIHRNTITFSLVKNKRPPSRLVEDTDFLLDAETGRVRRYKGEAAHAAVYTQGSM